jgi:hypothetical protein
MESSITKSDFIRFLHCPRFAWLWKHRPELRGKYGEMGRFAKQGREVELLARKLFPKGKEVKAFDGAGFEQTQRLIREGARVIYQATAITSHYEVRADILVRDVGHGQWHLYEVKSSSTLKEEYLADVYFQWLAFEAAGIRLASIHLITINGNYIFKESEGVQPKKLFSLHDMTGELPGMEIRWKALVETAYHVLTAVHEPKVLVLNKGLKHELPPEMREEYWKGVPEFSVYRIAHIAREQLLDLIGRGILDIGHVPDDYFSSDRQRRQVQLTKSKGIFVDRAKLKAEFRQLRYPLYFLDYETIMPAVPMFDGHKPYQIIPFQYSLHVIDHVGAKPKHYDYLHTRKSDPMPSLLRILRRQIGDKGSVLAWNAPFEKSCNQRMAERNPTYQAFLGSVNDRLYDLALIFKDIYVDYRFKGSVSIKNILPVMIPELSYEALEIRNGEMAIESITRLIGRSFFGRTKIIRELKQYCELDTLAMVRIYEVLIRTAKGL